jgi:hypothetical protein
VFASGDLSDVNRLCLTFVSTFGSRHLVLSSLYLRNWLHDFKFLLGIHSILFEDGSVWSLRISCVTSRSSFYLCMQVKVKLYSYTIDGRDVHTGRCTIRAK